ncbi:DNA-processing protein DprA [Demequina sp.]|uniref:DNA-processing protein DprA n=1 Tax=Demequina sp. TaxID=2050685 RepID=UPI003D127285
MTLATTTTCITPEHPAWPAPLNDLGADTPKALYVRGNPDTLARWADAYCLTGARACTAYGQHVASELAADLADLDIPLITGGAYGTDAAAIRGHLPTPQIVMLASGLDRLYPAGNTDLLHQVLTTGGALVSAHADGAAPSRDRFLARHDYLATARATIVIEAASRSGALTVATTAGRLGRPIGAVPGPVTSTSSVGTHNLIRHGARIITNRDDLVALTA